MRETLLPLPVQTTRSSVRYSTTGAETRADVVATEYALTIHVNDQELATIVCTPEHLADLVIGFLASEGVIRAAEQVRALTIVTSQGVARVKTDHGVNFNQAFYNKRYIGSCCGKSRQSFYFYNDAHTAIVAADSGTRFHPQEILGFMRDLDAASAVFKDTGGVHSAGLCSQARGLHLVRSDIGRHNALDKLYGHRLQTGESAVDQAIAFTGRLSSEVLLKAAKIGVGLIVAKSAPTALALDMAEELNITAIGFARGQHFTAYTHPWRIEI